MQTSFEDMILFYNKEIKEAKESVKYWEKKRLEYLALHDKQMKCKHPNIKHIPARERDMNCWDPGAPAYNECEDCGKRIE